MHNKLKGFTLIELIVVIGIIAILAAIVIVAINPSRQFAQARNAQRSSDVNAVLSAVHQYAADNNGSINGLGISATCPTTESVADSNATYGTGTQTLSSFLVPTYVSAMPTDPQPSTGGDYAVCVDSAGRVTVNAPSAELGKTISITR